MLTYHKRSPTTRLASAGCYTELDLSEGRLEAVGCGEVTGFGIHGQEGDVSDCFYNYVVERVADRFGIDVPPLAPEEWRAHGIVVGKIYRDRGWIEPDPHVPVHAVVRVVCMGWSWALDFANGAVALSVEKAKGARGGEHTQIRERRPAPILQPCGVIAGVYVDNVTILGAAATGMNEVVAAVDSAMKREEIPLVWAQSEPVQELESVGIILDLKTKRLFNKPRSVEGGAGAELLRRQRIRGEHLEIWAGHMVSLFQIRT